MIDSQIEQALRDALPHLGVIDAWQTRRDGRPVVRFRTTRGESVIAIDPKRDTPESIAFRVVNGHSEEL